MTAADLIERLEHEQPSQELDDLIAVQVGRGDRLGAAPKFTSSIDAALTLAPEPTVSGDKGRVLECRFDFGRSFFWATVNHDHHGRGTTPAAAITSAALKARARAQSLPKETG